MADEDLKPPVIPQVKNERGTLRPARPATEEEMAQAVRALKPFHCSFPTGKPLARQTGLPCRRRKVKGRNVCRSHGGTRGRGVSANAYKHGRYSNHVPEALLSQFQSAFGDDDYLDSRAEIATATTRIMQLWGRLEGSGSSEAWRELRDCYVKVQEAVASGDDGELNKNLDRIGEIVMSAGEAEAAWQDMFEALELRSKLVDKDWKRQRDMKQVLTMAQALDLVSSLVGCVTRHVEDRTILAAIHVDINNLIQSPGALVDPDVEPLPKAIVDSQSSRTS